MEKQHVHNLIILDESGSMTPIKNPVLTGFNEIVETIKGAATQFPEQAHDISFYSFNGLGIKKIHFMQSIDRFDKLDENAYQPNASTPLLDAMGEAILKLKNSIPDGSGHNVLVTVFTDGYENASREFTLTNIQQIVADLTKQGWTFTYIGTDHDVSKVAKDLNIDNVMSFSKNKEGIKDMFKQEQDARMNFYMDIKENKKEKKSYFKK